MVENGSELEVLCDRFLDEQVRLHRLSALSVRNYRPALRRLRVVLGERPISSISEADVEQWLMRQKHLSTATRRTRFSMMRQFCRWLIRKGHITSDPTREVPPPKLPRSVPRALPKAAIRRLVLACPDARARAIVVLMVELGLRCVEVSNLQIGDWDTKAQTIRIVGKGGHERVLPMTRAAAGALRVYLLGWPVNAGPLFRSKRNHARALESDSISRLVAQWMTDAGIKTATRDGISAHALRHTAASDVLEQCGDLLVVQEMLGHVHLATTSIYLRRAGLSKLRDAMEGRDYPRIGSRRQDVVLEDELAARTERIRIELEHVMRDARRVMSEAQVLLSQGGDPNAMPQADYDVWLETTDAGRVYELLHQFADELADVHRHAWVSEAAGRGWIPSQWN